MKKQQDYREDIEKFQTFVFEMDDVLEAFVAQAIDQGVNLDYSVESLDHLERYLDQKSNEKEGSGILNRAARYLGEVFRRKFGGGWDLSLDDPKNINFRLPIIAKYSDLDIEFCPIEIVSNYIVRRKPGLLRTAVLADEPFVRK